ncbi:MAG: right-handed parallel beta-helix repeat-containing protein [Candidatus Polarisedimenticolaceae bacterium]|nr:right-handed parallel beta-helix repeat-containing protein [Candidatus Polarisedimenticolaceae bacterium]
MFNKKIIRYLAIAIPLVFALAPVQAQDFPHSFDGNGIGCFDCHDIHGSADKLLKIIDPNPPENIEDTPANNLCWSCHNDVIAPFMRTHSSISIDDGYGDWAMECRTCHNPHFHPQQRYNAPDSYLTQRTISSVTSTLLTSTGAGWTPDEFAGLILFPDLSNSNVSNRILSNTADSITVKGTIHASVASGASFAVGYGKLIHQTINAPDRGNGTDQPDTCSVTDNVFSCTNTFPRPVKFYRATDANSFADPDDTETDGPCQVCHSRTTHFRFDGTGPDQWHTNVKGGTAGLKCTEVCHKHQNGFAHGGTGVSGGQVTTCVQCHGHEEGTRYDPDGTYPYTDPGEGGLTSYGAGTTAPHSTHTESWPTTYPPEAHADDKRGPAIYCSVCHNTDSMPTFKSGNDLDGNGVISLAETDVCDSCHSPEGTYNGVNSVNGSIGAKDNWNKEGVYTSDGSGTLRPDKGKWCAGCHDESPSVIANWGSISAPNIVGDEDGDYIYGTGWGFYKTGHGLPNTETIPSTGGVKNGPGRQCYDCHDTRLGHIDGDHRTFDCSDDCDPNEHQASYRLKRFNGEFAMKIPFPQNDSVSYDDFRLCFSCHDSGPFLDIENMNTNMKTNGVNRHNFHLSINFTAWPADYNFAVAYNSRPTCLSCHNVHGSTNLAMIRDGKLIDREPGLKIWYNNDDIVSYNTGNSEPPVPEDVPLAASTGTIWRGGTTGNLCANCHGNNNTLPEYRTPFQDITQAPHLYWSDQAGYITDGVFPDMAQGGSTFTFQIQYQDTNNDTPSVIEVWVDLDDSGTYELGEKFAMTAAIPSDTNYFDGKLYSKSLTISRAGDNTLNYRFYASDGTADAGGIGTNNSSLYLLNATPTLTWVGITGFTSDGVSPNYGGNDETYLFRVSYTDDDNQCPTAGNIQVWIDENDDGGFAVGEMFNLAEVDGADSNCADGKHYTLSKTITYAGDGTLEYRFYATDGLAEATGTPVTNSSFNVNTTSNSQPVLTFEPGVCRTEGVAPLVGATGGSFDFTVNYTDSDIWECSPTIQVWIDSNDNAVYEASEKIDLTEVNSADISCSDGKFYQTTQTLSYFGDGNFNYRFYANDGADDAVGEASSDRQVTALNALKVRPAGGAGWYSTIQSAIDITTDAHTVVVYDGTYNEDLNFNSDDDFTTVQSACGADSTIIDGTGKVVAFNWTNTGSVIDGFQITGGQHGVYINNASPTIKNSKIHNNDATTDTMTNGGGLYNTGATSFITVDNVEIYNNKANTGAGIVINSGQGNFSNLIVRNNIANSSAGGLYLQSTSNLSFTNVEIRDNSASFRGGGIYFNSGGNITFDRCIISGNTSVEPGGGWFANNTTSSPVFENCIVANNSGSLGGGFFLNSANTTLINSTLIDNSASAATGGLMYIQGTSQAIIRNSIMWENSATSGSIGYTNGGVITISDSIMSNDNDDDFTNRPYFASNGALDLTLSGITTKDLPNFIDAAADNYHLQYPSPAIDSASATYAPAIDLDGITRPQGIADDMGAYEVLATGVNTAPTLTWTGETNYETDSVDPVWGLNGSDFTFRIDFSDVNNTLPSAIQVWLDENHDGAYSESEKYAMSEADAADSTTSDGKRYTLTKAVEAPAGKTFLSYRLYASDGQFDAIGAATEPALIAITNNPPTMAWTGEASYGSDGVNPDSGDGGSDFTFRVDVIDSDNTLPTLVEVLIDIDNSGTFDATEHYAMSETDAADTTTSDGKRYTLTRTIPYVESGFVSYKFSATDGMDSATEGLPVIWSKSISVTLPANTQPTLSWSVGSCRAEGVRPPIGASYSDFEFEVNYSDADNQCPADIQVWVDSNDNGSYDTYEKHLLTEVSAADTVCSDGKLYEGIVNLVEAGDGHLNYRFYANDTVQEASGAATVGGSINVIDALRVRPTGGADWYSTIYDGIIGSNDGSTILVYPNAAFTATTYSENLSPLYLTNRTLQSVCGNELTTIASASGGTTLYLNYPDNVTIDGFSITGATNTNATGLYVNGGSNAIIKNNKIHNNAYGLYLNNGISATIDNNEIYSNTIRGMHTNPSTTSTAVSNSEFHSNGSAGSAAGIYYNYGSHTITDSIFHDNNTPGTTGAVLFNGASVDVTNTVFKDNTTTGSTAGAVAMRNGAVVNFSKCTFTGNRATASAGGAIEVHGAATVATFENCIIANNQGTHGGAAYMHSGHASFTNVTFADNQATVSYGGVFYSCLMIDNTVRNSIFWNNSAAGLGQTAYKDCGAYPGFMTITHSNVDTSGGNFVNGAPSTNSNVDPAVDPLFIDAAGGDYHIQSSSLMIDRASATYAPADDIDGETRPMGTADDIGADEAN